MKKKSFPLLATLVVTFLAALGSLPGADGTPVWAQGGHAMNTQSFTNKEYVRNGTFDGGKTAWFTNLTGTNVGAYGKNGSSGMQIWPDFSSNYDYIFQELYLPTQITAATLSFDYRFEPQSGAAFGGFRARLITDNSDLSTPLYVTVYPGGDWQSLNAPLSSGDVAALQAARDAGQRVYLIIDLSSQFLYADVDNVSFKVDGSMTYPSLAGSIAYIGLDGSGVPKTVNRIDPDGNNQQTLWTHPGSTTNKIYDVAWNPDATELAFSSDHEFGYSAFNSDVYGIKPDGSGLRRITNPPSKADVDAGKYPLGTVTGKVSNNYGSVASFSVYVEGAKNGVIHSVGNFGDTTSFTVPNVADLGSGVLQYAVFFWSSLHCPSGIEYTVAVVDVQANQTVDAGTLQFNGHCNSYNTGDITWKRDGSQVGFSVSGVPSKVPVAGEAIGTGLFSGTSFAHGLAWSPVSDQILYRNELVGGNSGIYLTTAGGGAGSWLVNDGSATWVTPAWLPDGSGFVYTLDHYIYQYNFSSSQSVTLTQFYNEYAMNPSVSPDGNYIVFQRETTGTPVQYDLWILNRNTPTEMWALTSDGKSINPDWSRVNPQNPSPTHTPTATATTGPGPTNTPTVTPNPNFTPTAWLYLPLILR